MSEDCQLLTAALKKFTCVRELSLGLPSKNFEVEDKGNKFILRATNVETQDKDLDFVIRKKMLAKNTDCTLNLFGSDYINGLSVQILEYPEFAWSQLVHKLTDKLISFVFADLAMCLSILHEVGFVHANLSPQQIYFNKNRKVKLLSFESAIEIGRMENGRGTIPYIAPEVIENWTNRQLIWTPTQDIWSYGAIFYEAIFGEPPFVSKTLNDLKEELKNTPAIVGKPPLEITFVDVLNKSIKINEKNRSTLTDFQNVLGLSNKYFGKYIERQVSISLNSFTVLEKASLIEMFSEMIFIFILCLFIIPISVYLISAKVESDEAQMNLPPVGNRARQPAPQPANLRAPLGPINPN